MSAPTPLIRRAGQLVGELINTVDDSDDLLAFITEDGTVYNLVALSREQGLDSPATVWLRLEER